uniref:Uncharacterized protein n=1 Tax=Anguilla anguilla TaxID=7936 RepID=A0A0E9PUT0_ANGAN
MERRYMYEMLTCTLNTNPSCFNPLAYMTLF